MARSKKVVDEIDDELEEMEEAEEEKPVAKKAKKGRKASAPVEDEKPTKKSRRSSDDDEEASAYGAAWLAEYVNEQTGKEYTAANIRVLLRKLAADGTLDRAVGEDRSRYTFTGPNDPIVKAVIKHVQAGTLEREKAERIAAVKEKGAQKKAAKKAAAPVEDDDDDDDEEEKPAPKKKATRRR